MDLAAAELEPAVAFYRRLFGWDAHALPVGAGCITRFSHAGNDIASAYQLRAHELAGGVPSHWTPYVEVADTDCAAAEAARLGGRVVVRPFTIEAIGRISLVEDPVGALIGLYQPLPVTTAGPGLPSG